MKKINLALQGGGAHGAYTWGVLDRLLEEDTLFIEGVSGTSAGAMNAVLLANGLEKNGREGAKEELEMFWLQISELGKLNPLLRQTPLDHMLHGWNLDSMVGYNLYDSMTRLFSPYMLNPLNSNILGSVVESAIDFELLRNFRKIKLYISATSVRTGQAKIFHNKDLNLQVLLASACLPFIAQAVEIEGEYYWDGGFMGNPSLWPLIYGCQSKDILLVQINPLVRHKLPTHAHEIINRVNEISFNGSLIAEMRAIHFVSKMIRNHKLDHNVYKDLHMHMIESSEAMQHLNASSKMNTSLEFLLHLKEIGRNAADMWLKNNYEYVGYLSSLDIEQVFFPSMLDEHPYVDKKQEKSDTTTQDDY